MIFPTDSPFYQYVLQNGFRPNPVLQQLRDETQKLPMAIMMVTPDQVYFFQFLLKLLHARKVIEIGVFTGYCTVGMALALPDDGKIIACDISEDYASIGKPYWKEAGVEHKIDLKIQPAIQTLDQLIANNQVNTFDFIFIDAEKYEYCDYYERSIQLLRKDGVMAIDNTLWRNKVPDESITDVQTQGVRDFNMKIKEDPRVEFIMVTIADGLTLARKI